MASWSNVAAESFKTPYWSNVAAASFTTSIGAHDLTVSDQNGAASMGVVSIDQAHNLSVVLLRVLSNPESAAIAQSHEVAPGNFSAISNLSDTVVEETNVLTVSGLSAVAALWDVVLSKVMLPADTLAVARLGSATLQVPFSVISVSADDRVVPDEDDVVVICSSAGDVMGKVFWGDIEQPIKSWANDIIVVGPVKSAGKAPGIQYAWDVWKPL